MAIEAAEVNTDVGIQAGVHELGHSLGLDHIENSENLMNPTTSFKGDNTETSASQKNNAFYRYTAQNGGKGNTRNAVNKPGDSKADLKAAKTDWKLMTKN